MNLAELYEASRTRAAKQHVIEDHICGFRPDYMEALELIAAIRQSLRDWTENSLGAELEADFESLMDCLNESDNTAQVRRYDDNWTDMSHERQG